MYAGVIDHNSSPTYTTLSILKELKKRSHHAYYLSIDKLTCEINNGKSDVTYNGKSIKKIDLFFLRTLGNVLNSEKLEYRINLIKTIERMGKLVINPIDGYTKARNKFTCLSILASKNIKVPPTLVTENEHMAYEFIKKMGKCVIKPIIGSRGIGSFLVEDADVSFRLINELKEKGYVLYIQKYINKPNRDLRVFVVGDEVLGVMARESTNWKTNIYQGGKGVLIETDEKVRELALKATKELGLYYSGVDIAEEGNDYYILEINASPLWHEFKSVSGINPAEKIVDLAERLLKR